MGSTENIFDKANEYIRGAEGSIVNLLSALAPWGAPLAPAYLGYVHMTKDLGFPVAIAMFIAFVIEVLGLSTISTSIQFWSHNRRYTSEKSIRRMPLIIPVSAFVMYMATILTMNVLLETAKIQGLGWDIQVVKVFAVGLLTVLSIPAAVILAVRTQYHDLLNQIESEREDRRKARVTSSNNPVTSNKETTQIDEVENWLHSRHGEFQWKALEDIPTAREIVRQLSSTGFDVNPATAQRALKRFKQWYIENE